LRRDYRKPLIVMTSKKLLRYKPACSNLNDFDEGKRFRWVIPDDLDPLNINHVI
jgi:2-oxoglutarate dehydrogenase E1 component